LRVVRDREYAFKQSSTTVHNAVILLNYNIWRIIKPFKRSLPEAYTN
jgi:hypothetical protein